MEQHCFPFQQSLKSQLTGQVQQLIAMAQDAAGKAYAPYSRFKVGAALLLNDGTMLSGNNHENASSPAGICAERAVLGKLDMDNKNNPVKAIAITYESKSNDASPLSPCGLCRQSLLEVQQWQQSAIAVYMCSPADNVIYVEDAAMLLPFFFGSNALASVTPPVNSPF